MRTIIALSIVGFLLLSLIVVYAFESNPSNPVSEKENPVSVFINKLTSPLRVRNKFAYAIFIRGHAKKVPIVSQSNSDFFENEGKPGVFLSKKGKLKWRNFFDSQPYFLSQNCLIINDGVYCNNEAESLSFFLNGNPSPNLFDIEISDDQIVTISYGSSSQNESASQNDEVKKLLAN